MISQNIVSKNPESELEKRMHQALKEAWIYVNIPYISRTARNEVGHFVDAESVAGRRVDMLFALQTAWTFVHGSGNHTLMAEIRSLLNHDAPSVESKHPLKESMTAITDKPLADKGFISYRYKGPMGWIMIGANDDAEAMKQAARSTTDPEPKNLQVWNGTTYVDCQMLVQEPAEDLPSPGM
jgi:hypothetical protein